MLVTLLAAPRTAAAAGGPVSPAMGPVPTRTAAAGRLRMAEHRCREETEGNLARPRPGSGPPKEVWGATLSEPRTPSPAPGAVEVIGVSGLARNGQTELDHAV